MTDGIYPWHPEVLHAMRPRRFRLIPRFSRDAFGNINVRVGRKLYRVWRV